MPVRSKGSKIMWTTQPKYVEIPPVDAEIRPQLEKMLSCDLSVEESYTKSDASEEEILKAMCGFPKKPVRERDSHLWNVLSNQEGKEVACKKIGLESPFCEDNLTSLNDLEENKAAFKKIGFEHVYWKIGAVENEKPRSLPIEHDDRDNSIEVDHQIIDVSFPIEGQVERSTKNPQVQLENNRSPQSGDKGAVIHVCGNPFPSKGKFRIRKKSTGPLKRQSIGKKKRNKWVILCDEVPSKPIKQKRISCSKKLSINKANKKCKTQFKDSGVSTGSSYDSGSASAGESGSQEYTGNGGGGGNDGGGGGGGGGGAGAGGAGGGGAGGGGAGFHKKGGIGGAGRDDDDDKRPFSSRDTEMKDEDDETEDDDVKMKSRESVVCSDMDLESDSLVQSSVDWQNLPFKTQHIQHSCYCPKMDCERPLCSEMKKELLHYKDKYAEGCGRCQRITNLLKLHAATCQRCGCRVPNCSSFRRMKYVQPQQVLRELPSNVYNQPQSVDGKVIYSNLEFIPFGSVFQESIDYHKGHLLGKGTNGNVYPVNFQPGCELNKKSMVVKETNYQLNKDELDVYKSMGEHANIVEHHCVTIKGHELKTCVFMERCDKSLKDVCDVREMDTKESMFYWTQVLAAVDHLHDKGIIHKDIKGKNILLSELPGEGEYCRAKLADFDSAKKLQAEFTQSGLKPMGTPGFVAPEVLEKKPHGRPADIYSMGCLLLELNGITPKLESLQQQVRQLYEKEPGLGELVCYCVQNDYLKRPTAKEIMNHKFIQTFMKIPDQV